MRVLNAPSPPSSPDKGGCSGQLLPWPSPNETAMISSSVECESDRCPSATLQQVDGEEDGARGGGGSSLDILDREEDLGKKFHKKGLLFVQKKLKMAIK